MKVHFASGTHPFKKPWHNVDYWAEAPGVDQAVDLLAPDWPENLTGIKDAYVGHFLEHLYPAEGVAFLTHLRTTMTPGARLTVVGPDAEKGHAWFKAGKFGREMLDAICKHGTLLEDDPNNRGNVHLWDCTAAAVLDMLTQAGFDAPTELTWDNYPKDVPLIDPAGWQFLIVAYNRN